MILGAKVPPCGDVETLTSILIETFFLVYFAALVNRFEV